MTKTPTILTFDSGLGGLTVHAEVVRLRPSANYVYAADDAGFPYGGWEPDALNDRVQSVMSDLIAQHHPDLVVIACNTASTLVLPRLRKAFPNVPFVGTVPAIKPAATHSKSKLISVLATPGTVARDYTHDLIKNYAADCQVTLVGAKNLASIAEAYMRGAEISDSQIAAEITPCFVTDGHQRTDYVVLACTHYPLLINHFKTLAPWSVEWIDSAPAIARRVDHVLTDKGMARLDGTPKTGLAVFTSGDQPTPELAAALGRYHLEVAG